MKAPASSQPALEPLRPESTSSVAQRGESCPFACLRSHVALYPFGAQRTEDAVATICRLCDQSFTRTWFHNQLISTGSAPDGP